MADSQVLTSENNKISSKLRVIYTGCTGFGYLYTDQTEFIAPVKIL